MAEQSSAVELGVLVSLRYHLVSERLAASARYLISQKHIASLYLHVST